MTIAILGATGFVGTALLSEALTRGHHLTAIVRDPTKLTTYNDRLIVVAGDVNHPAQLARQLVGHDLVLSAFNPGWTPPDLYNAFLTGSRTIEQATAQAGVPRLLVIGGAVVFSSTVTRSWIVRSFRLCTSRDLPLPATT